MKASAMAVGALFAALSLSCGRVSVAAPEDGKEAIGHREPPFKIVVLVPSSPSAAASGEASGSSEDGLSAGLAPGMVTIVRYAGRLSSGSSAWDRSLELIEQEEYKALVALSAPLGSVGLFEALRERRPDLMLVAMGYPEDPLAMQAAADLAVTVGHEARSGALIHVAELFKAAGIAHVGMKSVTPTWEAAERADALSRLAAERALDYTFIELNTSDLRKDPALLAAELVEARLAVMEPSGGEGGASAPEGGTEGAAGLRWVFTSDLPELAERLLYAALDKGVFYIESAAPQFGLRYGGAENLEDMPRAFDSVALSRDAAGRAAFWPGEQPETLGRALLAHVAASVEKPALLRDAEALGKALRKAWPASAWLVEPYRDPDSKVRAKNHLTLFSYPYVAGRGYIKIF
jgi:hypothetical protein